MRKVEMMEELCIDQYPLSQEVRDALDHIRAKDSKAVAGVFQAIADPARVKIIEALGHRELCVCFLVELTGLQYSALSYHLKQLKDAELISSHKEGTYLIYSLTLKGRSFQKLILKYDGKR
jgi:ArsR family transcriptional regulator, lead/cadmium/zinc/bismuth-responsive transcriptional repressor